jgi:hypothetical protein
MRLLSFAILATGALGAAVSPHHEKPGASIDGYSFVLSDDSSHARGINVMGYRMWVHATPSTTRIDFAEHTPPTAPFGLIDRKTRIGMVPAKEDVLQGSIDAPGGPVGALAWPDEHPDQYRNIVVRDSAIATADSLLGRPALHWHFTLSYDEWDKHRLTTEDCWYVAEPDIVHDAVNHATRFFGLTTAKDAALAFAIWAKTPETPVRCTTVVTLDDRPQYSLRITHETWVVSDVHADSFDAAMFTPPAGTPIRSPHQPFKP